MQNLARSRRYLNHRDWASQALMILGGCVLIPAEAGIHLRKPERSLLPRTPWGLIHARPPGLRIVYLPRTASIPASTSSSSGRGSLPARAVRRSLRLAIRWRRILSGGRSGARLGERFPAPRPIWRLLVRGMQTTVAMRLGLNQDFNEL
jgi:hypothetical protein